ncbi:MAG: hypothetical protein ACYCXN_07505 [Acidimicrobiales bacterium]|jgi:hypothetical protein
MRMVHLRTVPDFWQANVLAARLGSAGIVTELRANLSRPYAFGAVSVLVEEDQADLAAELLLADEVEAAFSGDVPGGPGTPLRLSHPRWVRYRRLLAALAAVLVAGAPVLAHFLG